jgi:hypothetical protein
LAGRQRLRAGLDVDGLPFSGKNQAPVRLIFVALHAIFMF